MPVSISELTIFDPYNVYTLKIKGDSFKSAQFMDALLGLNYDFRSFIFESEMPHQIKDLIAMPFELDEQKSSELARLVMEIILGWVYLGDIIKQIGERLQLDQETAKQIAAVIINQVFQPILPQLKQMHIQKFSGANTRENITQPTPEPPIIPSQPKPVSSFRPVLPRPPAPIQPRPSNNVIDLRNKT